MSPSRADLQTIAILSPGDMGHAIAHQLRHHGFNVTAYLKDRSDRTRSLAAKAGVRECETLTDLVTEAQLVLSILVPAQAQAAAEAIAQAVRDTDDHVVYADCNAISPQSAITIDRIMSSAGATFVDASIIGFPPSDAETPRVYVSGPHADALQPIDGCGVDVIALGDRIGQASGLKMCYAGLTKGRYALHFALLFAARELGLTEPFLNELKHSQADTFERMSQQLPRLPSKAHRWVGEMEQIAKTLQDADVPSQFHLGAAEIYRLIANSQLGSDTPEDVDKDRSLEDTIARLTAELRK